MRHRAVGESRGCVAGQFRGWERVPLSPWGLDEVIGRLPVEGVRAGAVLKKVRLSSPVKVPLNAVVKRQHENASRFMQDLASENVILREYKHWQKLDNLVTRLGVLTGTCWYLTDQDAGRGGRQVLISGRRYRSGSGPQGG